MGNAAGVVGYGFGKGMDFQQAMARSIE